MSVVAPEQESGSFGEYNRALYPTIEGGQAVRQLGYVGLAWVNAWYRTQVDIGEMVGILPHAFADVGRSIINANVTMGERMAHSYGKPEFGITETTIDGQTVAVKETIVEAQEKTFSSLLHFATEGHENRPRLYLIPPMSGHYPTLLRDTVRGLLPTHDVYVAGWKNARDIPAESGNFGLDDYIDYVIDNIDYLGPDTDVFAVCQATVPALAAVARIAEETPEKQPRNLILMAGPVDGRISPTVVNEVAADHSIGWFETSVIGKVGRNHPGAGRLVYPGMMQLMSFMSMNVATHIKSNFELYRHLVNGDENDAKKIEDFYNEYFSVSDLPDQFYLETVQKVFQEHQLARGILMHRGKLVDPSKIRKTALLTIEGEKDDICGTGQTMAALDLCSGIPGSKKRQYLQEGVGHYGTFSGKRWEYGILPVINSQTHVLAA